MEYKTINGSIILIDEEDLWLVELFDWKISKVGYIFTYIEIDNKRYRLYLHRLIANIPRGMFTDHINHNLLDNQKMNLRSCTNSQNQMNSKPRGGYSKYKGVTWNKKAIKWQAHIRHKKKYIYLGLFHEEIAAAQAFDIIARKLFGEFAYYNNT
jgi:hypothetical protein